MGANDLSRNPSDLHLELYLIEHINLITLFSLLAQNFQTFMENMKILSSLSKILETRINVFKSNSSRSLKKAL